MIFTAEDFKIGQTACIVLDEYSYFAKQIKNKEYPDEWIRNVIIQRVGKKYIIADNCKFDVTNDFREVDSCGGSIGKLFPNRESAQEFQRAELLYKKLYEEFEYNYKNNGKFTFEQIKNALIVLGLKTQ